MNDKTDVPVPPPPADARAPDPARRALRLAYVLRHHHGAGATPELARLLADYRGQEPS